jgi:hypothetical protein
MAIEENREDFAEFDSNVSEMLARMSFGDIIKPENYLCFLHGEEYSDFDSIADSSLRLNRVYLLTTENPQSGCLAYGYIEQVMIGRVIGRTIIDAPESIKSAIYSYVIDFGESQNTAQLCLDSLISGFSKMCARSKMQDGLFQDAYEEYLFTKQKLPKLMAKKHKINKKQQKVVTPED